MSTASVETLRVERLNRAGEGVAAGLRIPMSLPGELVRGAVADGVLAVEAVLEPSESRVIPPCRHFGVCGGCALQHASDAFIAGWKTDTTLRALAQRGLTLDTPPSVATSPARSRRRATFGGRRTRKTAQVGFHARRSDTLVDITDCPLIRPELLAAKPVLAEITRLGAARSGALRLALTSGPAGLDLDVTEAKPLDGDHGADLGAALARLAETADLARLGWNGETIAFRRPPLQPMGPAQVAPPPGAFLQATAEGAAALTEAVLAAIGPAARVADLFAGCGTFSLPLATRAEVHAVEGMAPALAALDAGWRATPGLHRVTTERRDLFRRPLHASELARFDALVIDPPRAGAEAQAREIAASAVPRVAMVSCDPLTFARDAAILAAGGYRLDWLRIIDQFRWSGHIEIAAQFTR